MCPLMPASDVFAPPCLDASCGADWDAALSVYSPCDRGPGTAALFHCGAYHEVFLQGTPYYVFATFSYDEAGHLAAAKACGGQGGCFYCCYDRRTCSQVPLGLQCEPLDGSCVADG